MTHSTSWAAGIVGAPVTDWRNYDTVYTERYMKTPQNNPEGFLGGDSTHKLRAWAAIDFPTLIILFGLMILSAQFAACGFYDWCSTKIATASTTSSA